MFTRIAYLATATLALAGFTACSDDDKASSTSTTPISDASTDAKGTEGTETKDAGDSGSSVKAPTVNACSTYKDETASTKVEIPWDFSISSAPERCVKVKVGTTVVFKGDFSTHPLAASGGDVPNPFDNAASRLEGAGTADEKTPTVFNTAGAFGFICSVHASMTGAVYVVP